MLSGDCSEKTPPKKRKLSGFENNTLNSALKKCLEKVGTAQFCLEDWLAEQIVNVIRHLAAL